MDACTGAAGVSPCGLLDDDKAPVPLCRVAVVVRAFEAAAHVTVKATFMPRALITDATFRCPVDDTRAAVTAFTFSSASRGEVAARVNASQTGKLAGGTTAAVGAGAAPKSQRDMFQVSLGSVGNEDVTTTLTYVQELPIAAHSILLTIPRGTTFPHCAAAGADRGRADGDRATVLVHFAASKPVTPTCSTHASAIVTCGSDGGSATDPPPSAASSTPDEAGVPEDTRVALSCAKVAWSAADGLGVNLVCTFAMPPNWVPAAVVQENENGCVATGCGATSSEEPGTSTSYDSIEAAPPRGSAAVVLPIMSAVPETNARQTRASRPPSDESAGAAPSSREAMTGAGAGTALAAPSPVAPTPTTQVVFVLDRSGSMAQWGKMEAVRQCMAVLLTELPATAAFDIVSFGSDHQSMFGKCVPATNEAVAAAQASVRAMQGDMQTTNLFSALKFVYDDAHDHVVDGDVPPASRVIPADAGSKPRSSKGTGTYLDPALAVQVIVLTDGRVDAGRAEIVQLVRANAHRSRCFTFGIGADVDGNLVRRMAFAGHGRCSFVGRLQELQRQAARRLTRALQRTWYCIKAQWPRGAHPHNPTRRQVPTLIPPLFHGEAHHVYLMGQVGLLGPTPLPQSMEICYMCEGVPARIHVPVVRASGLPPGTVARLAARARILEHETSGRDAERQRREVAPLSRAFGLASSFTPMVLRPSTTTASVHTERREAAMSSMMSREHSYTVTYTGCSDSDSGDEADQVAGLGQTMTSSIRTVTWHSRGATSTPVTWQRSSSMGAGAGAGVSGPGALLQRSRSHAPRRVVDRQVRNMLQAFKTTYTRSPVPTPARPSAVRPQTAAEAAAAFSAVKTGVSALAAAVQAVVTGTGHTLDLAAVFALQLGDSGAFEPSRDLNRALFGTGATAAAVPRLGLTLLAPTYTARLQQRGDHSAAETKDADCLVATAVVLCVVGQHGQHNRVHLRGPVAEQLARARAWVRGHFGLALGSSCVLHAFVFSVLEGGHGGEFLAMWGG